MKQSVRRTTRWPPDTGIGSRGVGLDAAMARVHCSIGSAPVTFACLVTMSAGSFFGLPGCQAERQVRAQVAVRAAGSTPVCAANARSRHFRCQLQARGILALRHTFLWTCRVFMPLQVLIQATLRAKAKELFPPDAECRRRGLSKPLMDCSKGMIAIGPKECPNAVSAAQFDQLRARPRCPTRPNGHHRNPTSRIRRKNLRATSAR